MPFHRNVRVLIIKILDPYPTFRVGRMYGITCIQSFTFFQNSSKDRKVVQYAVRIVPFHSSTIR